MLIETDAVDWSKPIVYYNPLENKIYHAVLITKHFATSTRTTHAVVIYRFEKDKMNDMVTQVTESGTSANNIRVIYNTTSSADIPELAKDVADKVKILGQF